jgi:hypothetical protein
VNISKNLHKLVKFTLVRKKKTLPKLSQIFVGRKNKLIKLSIKSGKDGTGTPCLVTKGTRFQKTGEKSTLGFKGA